MLTREEILTSLESITTEANKARIEELMAKISGMSDEQLQAALKEKNIKSVRDVKKVVQKMSKEEKSKRGKFEELNDVVSYGTTGETIHIHLVPKDTHHMLTHDGRREAKIALVDALEKLKEKMKTEKKHQKAENIYAVSPIMTGIVARWFKELGFDVKTMPMEQAKEDKELGKFYGRFKDKNKLGRAILPREVLMSEEWEQGKNDIKEKLGVTEKETTFVEQLQSLNNNDGEIVQATEAIETRYKEKEKVAHKVIE